MIGSADHNSFEPSISKMGTHRLCGVVQLGAEVGVVCSEAMRFQNDDRAQSLKHDEFG